MTLPTEWKVIKFHGSSHHQPGYIMIIPLFIISSPYYHHIITISSPYHHHIITILSPYYHHISPISNHIIPYVPVTTKQIISTPWFSSVLNSPMSPQVPGPRSPNGGHQECRRRHRQRFRRIHLSWFGAGMFNPFYQCGASKTIGK